MYTLKNVDKNAPHHYFIVIVVGTLNSTFPNEMRMKYRPLYMHHNELINIQNAALLSQDKVFKTDNKEAIKIHNCEESVSTFSLIRMAASMNNGTMHHFYSKTKIPDPDEFFENLVKRASKDKTTYKEIMDGMMRAF